MIATAPEGRKKKKKKEAFGFEREQSRYHPLQRPTTLHASKVYSDSVNSIPRRFTVVTTRPKTIFFFCLSVRFAPGVLLNTALAAAPADPTKKKYTCYSTCYSARLQQHAASLLNREGTTRSCSFPFSCRLTATISRPAGHFGELRWRAENTPDAVQASEAWEEAQDMPRDDARRLQWPRFCLGAGAAAISERALIRETKGRSAGRGSTGRETGRKKASKKERKKKNHKSLFLL